jgi:hypothetical protein
MSDVEADNVRKRIKEDRERAKLAESAWHYFTQSPEGKNLHRILEHQSGANFSAFSAKDNFNPHGAAFRDGMRATFLVIQNLIKEHESATKSHPE